MLPVFVAPADPTTASGRYPARRSSAIIASRSGVRIRKRSSVGTIRRFAEPIPEQFDRLADAAVALVGDVDTEPWATGKALLTLVPARASVPGRREAGQVGHRAARDKNAARGGRKTDHLPKPVQDLTFEVDGRVVRDVAMRVHRGPKGLSEDRHDVGR